MEFLSLSLLYLRVGCKEYVLILYTINFKVFLNIEDIFFKLKLYLSNLSAWSNDSDSLIRATERLGSRSRFSGWTIQYY